MKQLAFSLSFALFLSFACCYPSYQDLIPNGYIVRDPKTNRTIGGVGHVNPDGSGDRNCFGKDFEDHQGTWVSICRLDSDGDGRSNGDELGDPNCVWPTGQLSATAVTHPGVCTPLDSPVCKHYNDPAKNCMPPA